MSPINKASGRNYVPKASNNNGIIPDSLQNQYPEPLDFDVAFHGVLGTLCRGLANYTAADPQAVYIQSLAALGAVAACPAPQDSVKSITAYEHITASLDFFSAPRLFVMIVGDTASYKGTSWGFAQSKIISKVIDQSNLGLNEKLWFNNNFLIPGISSGEGLIKKLSKEFYEEVEVDSDGEDEKYKNEKHVDTSPINRLVVCEEANTLLKNCKRPDSILSEIVRMAFDGRGLENPSKADAGYAPNPFCSIIAQTTPTELRNELDVDRVASNGFINRWLFVPVHGEKIPISQTKVNPDEHADLITQLADCLEKARRFQDAGRTISFTNAGTTRLEEVSDDLDIHGSDGVRKEAGARSTVFVARIAAAMALLDPASYTGTHEGMITEDHVDAARSWVNRSNTGMGYVFGWNDLTTDEEKAIEGLESSDNGSLTRTQISTDVFSKKKSAAVLNGIARSLISLGHIEVVDEPSRGKRGIQRWTLLEETSPTSPQINAQKEESYG
tara:strand:+ start:1573 stop:3072 length:1500 start_codon:yes stop_codon:yes gene_type:complete